MHGAHEFLTALTIVLGVAAVTTYVFHRLRQPVVLGYVLAGLIIGPHVPIPLIASPDVVHTLSELGVILLMFGLGLEFRLGKLFRAAPTAGVTGLIQCSVMLLAGFATGQLLGWTTLESLFAGALISISSTTIIAKAFDEQRVQGRLRELVFSILIVEDLIAVVLMALLTGLSSSSGLSAAELGLTLARLGGFLVALIVVGLLVVPRVMRVIVRSGRAEMIVIAAVTACFGISLLAHELGYSVALGAFIAGILVAESGEARVIEPIVHPVRDIFAAVFFVSVGMMFDPQVLVDYWLAVLLLTAVVIVGKIVSVALGAFLVGSGTRTSVAAGFSLAQIGEFSFIIAGLGMSLGSVGAFLYPIAVAVSAITTLTTPWLIRAAGPASAFVDRKLPAPLQTFSTLYESWIERLRARSGPTSQARKLVRTLLLELAAVTAIVIALALTFDDLARLLEEQLAIRATHARIAIAVAGGAIVLPFCIGILAATQRLAAHLAEMILPSAGADSLDLGRPPRRMLIAALRLVGVATAGLPFVAITQPFLPWFTGIIVLVLALGALAFAFWRTARDLHGHVRAASHVILEKLAAQTAEDASSHADTDALLPGLSEWRRVVLPADSPAIGRTLAELQLRGTTGATVLAISRGASGVAVPDAQEPLRADDVLAIAGTHEAIDAAVELLGRAADAPLDREAGPT